MKVSIDISWNNISGDRPNIVPPKSSIRKTYLVLLSVGEPGEDEVSLIIDNAEPYGCFIDNFWDTEVDYPGKEVHVLAWADPRMCRIEVTEQ